MLKQSKAVKEGSFGIDKTIINNLRIEFNKIPSQELQKKLRVLSQNAANLGNQKQKLCPKANDADRSHGSRERVSSRDRKSLQYNT